ncbi:MAG: ABC transporter substrate-binding protein [Anaerolineae bacterium]
MFPKKMVLVLALSLLVISGLAACAPPTPVVVEKEVVVEKPVVETVEVVKEVVVEKVVTATPVPKVATKIKAWTIGPGPMPFTRATNLEEAATRLNALGLIPQKVVIETIFSELKWGPFSEKFFTTCEAKEGPHIVTLKDIPKLADGGFIVPLDDHVEKYWALGYDDFYPTMWEAVKYKAKEGPYAGEEHIWGIPQDATPGGIWYRKDVLRALGYSDEDIAAMLPSSAEGVTFDDIARLAREAKDAGLVEWGILHRPSPGDTIYIYMKIFGGRVYDPAEDKLVLTKSAALKAFEWFKARVDEGVLPSAPPAWGVIHAAFVDGKTLFTFASHVGTPSEWIAKYDLTDEVFKGDLGFMLFPPAVPGAKPVTTLGPLAYLVTRGCVKPEEENPEAAAALLFSASSADLMVKHTIQTMRPPIRKSAYDHPDLGAYAYADYIKGVAPMLEYAEDVPKHPLWGKYKSGVFEVIKAVEAGIFTPEAAVEELEKTLKADIPDIIVE